MRKTNLKNMMIAEKRPQNRDIHDLRQSGDKSYTFRPNCCLIFVLFPNSETITVSSR